MSIRFHLTASNLAQALPTKAFARSEYYFSYSEPITTIDRMTVVDLKTGDVTPWMEIFAYGSLA